VTSTRMKPRFGLDALTQAEEIAARCGLAAERANATGTSFLETPIYPGKCCPSFGNPAIRFTT